MATKWTVQFSAKGIRGQRDKLGRLGSKDKANMGPPCVMHMPQAGPELRQTDKQGTVPLIRVTQVSVHPARAQARAQGKCPTGVS